MLARAREYAGAVSDRLNGTMTDGVRVSAVVTPDGTTIVASGVTSRSFQPHLIPLTLGRSAPSSYLWLAYIVKMDEHQRYLAVAKSGYGVYLDAERREMLFHYDYEREPTHRYPPAHVQVAGDSPMLTGLAEHRGQPRKLLQDFHFPVGGRRFRPTLEDIIEFLIVEDLVDSRPGWRAVVAAGRRDWESRQLRAAVRRDPDPAIAQLCEDGHL
jgi:hypothetical protein